MKNHLTFFLSYRLLRHFVDGTYDYRDFEYGEFRTRLEALKARDKGFEVAQAWYRRLPDIFFVEPVSVELRMRPEEL